ncbi:MAG: gephyrin-like molybdotransferase Glp [Acidobacteriota bacterium]
MLTYEEALQELLANIPKSTSVRVPLREALGRVLAAPVVADMDLPPFRKSFVDGFAVRSQDAARAPVKLKVVGIIAAGDSNQPQIESGQAAQIMTGAAVPPGADAVQMVEKTEQVSNGEVALLEPVRPAENVAAQGREVQTGETVLEQGRVVGPAALGVLATFGQAQVEIYAAPRVAVIPTGDELVEVEQEPEFGQIRNSNAYVLWAQCRKMGLEATVFPPVPDDPEQVQHTVREALTYDLAIFTGGVSMGEYDYLPRVLADEGVSLFFHKAAIKPGKPILACRKGNHMIFGLPGNPVSAYVTFELFVRPAIRSWMGFKRRSLQKVSGELTADTKQKPGRKFFKQAMTVWTEGRFTVRPIETQGSADLVAFSEANSLLILEPSVTLLKAGQQVEALLLNHNGDDES